MLYTLKHLSLTSLISVKALSMVNPKQLSNKIKSMPKLSVPTRQQASAQETPTTSGASDDQEDLVISIKKIIKEEFYKHEKKIDEMIKLHLQSTNKRLDKISKDVIEVTKNLEFTQSMFNEELGTVKNDSNKLASNVKELENNLLDPNEVSEKIIELEDSLQRNNV